MNYEDYEAQEAARSAARKAKRLEEIKDGTLPLGEMDISNLPYNRLEKAGYLTLGQISAASDEELTSMRFFGPACLREVRRYIQSLHREVEREEAAASQ